MSVNKYPSIFSRQMEAIVYIDHVISNNLLKHTNSGVFWGISSNGRAPALHAGSTGIDTRILQHHDFYNLFFILSLLLFFVFLLFCYRFLLCLHAGSTGIDTQILQDQGFCYPFFFVSSFLFFLIAFLFFYYSANKTRGMCHDFLNKITVILSHSAVIWN